MIVLASGTLGALPVVHLEGRATTNTAAISTDTSGWATVTSASATKATTAPQNAAACADPR